MTVFFHGYSNPTIAEIQSRYMLPWDYFSLNLTKHKELKEIKPEPEILVFTLFKGGLNWDFSVEELKMLFPNTMLLCLANSFCLFVAEDLAAAGIDGYAILGSIDPIVFQNILHQIIGGEKIFPSLESKSLEGLTIKELITIRHIAAGLTAKQIAYLHRVTENTIKKRKLFIMERLNKHTTEEIAAWAALRMNIPQKEVLIEKGEHLLNFFR